MSYRGSRHRDHDDRRDRHRDSRHDRRGRSRGDDDEHRSRDRDQGHGRRRRSSRSQERRDRDHDRRRRRTPSPVPRRDAGEAPASGVASPGKRSRSPVARRDHSDANDGDAPTSTSAAAAAAAGSNPNFDGDGGDADTLDKAEAKPKKKKKKDKKSSKKSKKKKRRRDAGEPLDDDEDANHAFGAPMDAGGDGDDEDQFVWRAKEKHLRAKGIRPERLTPAQMAQRRADKLAELAKVKARREEREREREERMSQRDRENEAKSDWHFDEWEMKELDFHLTQARRRAEIRVREGRPKPIDVLYMNVNLDLNHDMDVQEPYQIFRSLTLAELEELRDDIFMYQEFDAMPKPKEGERLIDEAEAKDPDADLDPATRAAIAREKEMFWSALLEVAEHEIASQKRMAANQGRAITESGVHAAVSLDVTLMFANKSLPELRDLHRDIEGKAVNAPDAEFWRAVLQELRIYMAKAQLHDIHVNVLHRFMDKLKRTRRVEQLLALQVSLDQLASSKAGPEGKLYRETERRVAQTLDGMLPQGSVDAVIAAARAASERGGKASPSAAGADATAGEDADNDADQLTSTWASRAEQLAAEAAALEEQEAAMAAREAHSTAPMTAAEMLAQERAAVQPDEEAMERTAEVVASSQHGRRYEWMAKYEPRKPAYFNRVKTGIVWTKYNQTHYDSENPPPKVVQGYKFNIFYPDLIDPTQTPTYTVRKDDDNADWAIITFKAGPPYEDIAFRIVNRPWLRGRNHGFKSEFDRGILHVWFNLQRIGYRR